MNLLCGLQEYQRANVLGVLQQVAPGGTITGTGAPFPPTGYLNLSQWSTVYCCVGVILKSFHHQTNTYLKRIIHASFL